MIPFQLLPGASWAGRLPDLASFPGPLWLQGPAGSGVSTVARHLADARSGPLLDDADHLDPAEVAQALRDPRAVLAAHTLPAALAPLAAQALVVALSSLEAEPAALPRCLAALAEEEGLAGPLPSALAALPCPGELRGLRNRLLRWKLLGQLPTPAPPALPLSEDNLASNLHVLEQVLLHRALRRSYGNRKEAAQRLGISRRHLYLLIARHGDPVRGEAAVSEGPERLKKALRRQNSSGDEVRR